jgi:hypothetical protein
MTDVTAGQLNQVSNELLSQLDVYLHSMDNRAIPTCPSTTDRHALSARQCPGLSKNVSKLPATVSQAFTKT